MNLYHYTVGIKIPSILNDGYLKLTPKQPIENETPLVWVSSNELWEETANKAAYINGEYKVLTREQTSLYCNGLYRFMFHVNQISGLMQYKNLLKEKLIPETLFNSLIDAGVKVNANPDEWYASTSPLFIKNARLQVLHNNQWTDLEVV